MKNLHSKFDYEGYFRPSGIVAQQVTSNVWYETFSGVIGDWHDPIIQRVGVLIGAIRDAVAMESK